MFQIDENEKRVQVLTENGDILIKLHSTTGSVKITPPRFVIFMINKDQLIDKLKSISGNVSYSYQLHLGANVFASLEYPKEYIEIRQWKFEDHNKLLSPTCNGINLSMIELERLGNFSRHRNNVSCF